MKILEEGHVYALDNVQEGYQVVSFVCKEPVSLVKDSATDADAIPMRFVHDGTTNEEVLRMLIDRLHNLNMKLPCNENERALVNLHTALACLERRTFDRKERGVEGTNKP